MSFMKKYKQQLEKNDKVVVGLKAPEYFLHTGNYALNKLMSGRFDGGSAQGRVICFAGHSSSGKSLVAASHVASVVADGGFALVIDTEGASDDDFMRNVGVDVDSENYVHVMLENNTISECQTQVNNFIKEYKESGETTRALVVIDSLDNLLTDGESDAIDKTGAMRGDQGQHAKQIKRMGKPWGTSITQVPITILCTKHVFQEQDPMKALNEPWVVTESAKYICSQIILFEKLQYKDKSTKEHMGFTLKALSYKNRIAKEKQSVKIEVPFDNGIEPYSGIIDLAVDNDVLEKSGAWYTLGEKRFHGEKKLRADEEAMQEIVEKLIEKQSEITDFEVDMDGMVAESEQPSVKEQSRKKRIEAQHSEGDDD